ncbi:hypothetical protein Poly51_50960 [Rubripirellula tenax]|uniref:DUF2293 domain-containing protein n=1 Tax=Rubripirellula tenax TaxID=2528015 RepID=A0A5C6EGY5_9BACT|nr:hypothetical protein Poly51_50960 [Rubripirellula tenax]
MAEQTMDVAPAKEARHVMAADGKLLRVPDHWELLPPGDAGLTRRVKAAGPTWTVKEKKGRRTFSQGVWADASTIIAAKEKLESDRSTEAYAKRRQSDAVRREKKQSVYVEDFFGAVVQFLAFAPRYRSLGEQFAKAVTDHATPVGSGTVARTERIPIERRAESAVIAWMRHQTTAYDHMAIARVKGKRREVRRMLAEQSRLLLTKYRKGDEVDPLHCLLQKALKPSSTAHGDADALS